MATLSITVADAHVSRVIAAFEVKFGRQVGETDTQFARRILATYVRNLVLDYERDRDSAAAANAVTAVDAS